MNDLVSICQRPITQLMPHCAPMVFLDHACGMEGNAFKARVRITPASPMFQGTGVPAWVGLEYMAQTVAAYSGAQGLASGGTITMGMLLGTRNYHAEIPVFTDGMQLDILATVELAQDNGISSMNCRIRDADGRIVAHAHIHVIAAADLTHFIRTRTS